MTLVLGVPKCVRSDNGPEFIARAIQRWFDHVDVRTLYIEPSSPGENSCAESFHSRLRDQFLALKVFVITGSDHGNSNASDEYSAVGSVKLWKVFRNYGTPPRGFFGAQPSG